MAIDFQRMKVVAEAAREAFDQWESKAADAKNNAERTSFEDGFKAGAAWERTKWTKFRWHIATVEKPEPDSYIIALEMDGDQIADIVIGYYTADSEPYVSNAHVARMWGCIDKWCYFEDFNLLQR